MVEAVKRLFSDPRGWQIVSLMTLSFIQMIASDFSTSLVILALSVTSCMMMQLLWRQNMWASLPSAMITGLSLSLLLRTELLWLYPLAASIAISSKFTLNINRKHMFNPANIAIVFLLLTVPDYVWVSPGQWGSSAWLVGLIAGLAGLVLSRAGRLDIALGFLTSWALLIAGRALWLGDPLAIPLLQIQSGALLIFTFFMITDPRSTPNHRMGRLIFAASVAIIGFILQFHFHIREGVFYALALTCLTTPLLDSLIKAQRFQWGRS